MEEREYLDNIVKIQSRLFGYISSLHPFPHEVEDILQETNITLLEKRKDFDSSRDFAPWAFAISRFTWMAYRQKRARNIKRESYDPYIEEIEDSNILQHICNEINAEKKLILDKIITDLSSKEKKLFQELLKGKKIGQIAEEWGENTNKLSTCKSRMISKVKSLVSVFRE